MNKKLELKQKSDARVKNWPNTLEANRQRKENLKFEKFKEAEVALLFRKNDAEWMTKKPSFSSRTDRKFCSNLITKFTSKWTT